MKKNNKIKTKPTSKSKSKSKPKVNNHKYLCYTNILLILSILFFIYKTTQETQPNQLETVLATSLVGTIVFSQLFWNNPIKHSIIHKIDAIIAKIVIASFILYTLIYKYRFTYLLVLSAIAVSFYFSNHYSSQEWCSNKHLCCHASLHIFCFVATFYAFL
jgi:hypothetical protein